MIFTGIIIGQLNSFKSDRTSEFYDYLTQSLTEIITLFASVVVRLTNDHFCVHKCAAHMFYVSNNSSFFVFADVCVRFDEGRGQFARAFWTLKGIVYKCVSEEQNRERESLKALFYLT